MISDTVSTRVGVRGGAFKAHPPISTQTRDTRLLCHRSFPCAQEESACSGSLLRDSQVGVVATGTARHALREGVDQSCLAT